MSVSEPRNGKFSDFVICVVVLLSLTTATGWKNPRRSNSLNTPIFGTHDWIAFKGYVLAGRPTFIKSNLNRYFIGTEAPDNGFKPSNAEGRYNDAGACHCILFDEDGEVTRDRAEMRTRQEFDKAVAALTNGNRALAAFYAGALAHYIGESLKNCLRTRRYRWFPTGGCHGSGIGGSISCGPSRTGTGGRGRSM